MFRWLLGIVQSVLPRNACRAIIILVKAGAPVDQTIDHLSQYLEKGDCIIDGGNEWYERTM